ncbi:MAG: FliM/FliN family flagellar motor switch protein [Bryobacteraceae bacterium]
MSAPDIDPGRIAIAQQFTRAWESVLATMAPVRIEVELGSAAGRSAAETRNGWSWWALLFDLAPKAPLLIGAPARSWGALGKLVLGEEDSGGDEVEAVSKDLIDQCGSVLAQWFSGQSGHSVACQGAVPAGAGTGGPQLAINLKFPEAEDAVELLVGVPEELAREAAPLPPAAAKPVTPLASIVLPVEVILGRVTLQLAEVLKLNIGSVVDLERHVAEPAEVVVNGRVIAWGQIVACAGNYGVKITAKAKGREAA